MPNRGDGRARVVGAAVVLMLLVMAGLLLTGCGSNQPTIVTSDVQTNQPSNQDLQQILDRRAKALRDHAEQAYLADLDPANQQMIQHERMVFANLRQFKLADLHFILPGVTSALADQQKQGTYKFAPVIEDVQLTTDAGPTGVEPGESFEYDLTKKSGKWVVTGLFPLTHTEAQRRNLNPGVYADAPWDLTPLHVTQAGDIWLAGDDSVPDLTPYATAGQAELGKILALWGSRARFPGYVLFFTKNVVNLHAWYDLGTGVDKYEGVEIPLQGVRKEGEVYNGQYVGSRIVVELANVGLFGDDPSRVMRHELTHAVTARATSVAISLDNWGVQAPIWAVEGFARFVEDIDSPDRQGGERASVAQGVRAGKFTGQPPASEHFYDGDATAMNFNYNLGSSVFRFVSQTKGAPTAVEFSSRVIAYSDTGEAFVGTPAFDGICQRVLQTSGADFLQQWANFVRSGG